MHRNNISIIFISSLIEEVRTILVNKVYTVSAGKYHFRFLIA